MSHVLKEMTLVASVLINPSVCDLLRLAACGIELCRCRKYHVNIRQSAVATAVGHGIGGLWHDLSACRC